MPHLSATPWPTKNFQIVVWRSITRTSAIRNAFFNPSINWQCLVLYLVYLSSNIVFKALVQVKQQHNEGVAPTPPKHRKQNEKWCINTPKTVNALIDFARAMKRNRNRPQSSCRADRQIPKIQQRIDDDERLRKRWEMQSQAHPY